MQDNVKVGFVSLGCDKNRVDLENVITVLSLYPRFSFVGDKTSADVIIINTCAFLKASRDEGKSIIKEMAGLKKSGSLKKLVVMGCLALLAREKLKTEFPEVDIILYPEDYKNVAKILCEALKIDYAENKEITPRKLTTPLHYAYLKIADGCSNRCAYCKIPYFKGNYVSLPQKEVVDEATRLCERGVKEIILVAQDITRFGCETNGRENLVSLLKSLSKIKKLSWIRLLYCYPDRLTDEIIDEIKSNPKIVKYVDIPFQHVSTKVLKNMARTETKEDIETLICKLRKKIPSIKIRTTFMVGFPGETKDDVKELCDFLEQYKLDNVGFFSYSREEGTPSYDFENQIDEKEKQKRLKLVQKVQEKIADENNKKYIGKTLKVIVDDYDIKHGFYVARPYFSAPDIDFEVLLKADFQIKLGSFVDAEIVDYNKNYFIARADKRLTY